MPALADYPYRLEHLPLTEYKDDGGGPVPQFNPQGDVYWCGIEELSNSERLTAGVEVASVLCRVKIHQFPEVKTGDRLRDNTTGFVYDLTGAVIGDDELICDAIRKRPEAPGQ